MQYIYGEMESQKLFQEMIAMVHKNPMFLQLLIRRNLLKEAHVRLLHEILRLMNKKDIPQAKECIFQYGTLIGRKDSLERQIFICLFLAAEEYENMHIEAEIKN